MELDQQQLAAATTKSKTALVISGPGSGKTRVIVERAAYLIEECKVASSEILLVTFTRHAAGEMKTRLEERIGAKAFGVTVGTFHATALNLLHRFGELIGFNTKSTVYGAFEEEYLLRDVAEELGIFTGKSWKIKKADIAAVFGKYYQEGIEPEKDDPAYDLFVAYCARCKQNNSFTFGSLLTGLKLLLPQIHQYLQWKHIVLDEGHDTDRLQWEILMALREYCKASLFVVADLDQAIYQWRGACPEYLLQHQDEFEIYRLESNYRSVPSIVEASNRLIAHNVDRITKTMVATRTGGEDMLTVRKEIDSERLAEMLAIGGDTCAVLGRNHFLLEKLSRLLDEKGVAHEYIGRTTALTNSEAFRRYHAFLKLTINPYDNFSFLLIKDIVGVSRDDYGRIRISAAETGRSHFQVFLGNTEYLQYSALPGSALGECCGWIDNAFPELSPEASAFIYAWEKEHPDSIEEYLNWLALYEVADEIKEKSSGITLMTGHACKGLQFPVVIIAGANEGIIPSKQSIANGDEESERRLFYVMVTRAQDQLIVSCRPVHTEKDGRIFESPESRFIGETR
jgi:DNA helicase-2/ATP-dependent DNA helicase PcrA